MLTIEYHPFSTREKKRYIIMYHDEVDGKIVDRHHVHGSPVQLRDCVAKKLHLELGRYASSEEIALEMERVEKELNGHNAT